MSGPRALRGAGAVYDEISLLLSVPPVKAVAGLAAGGAAVAGARKALEGDDENTESDNE